MEVGRKLKELLDHNTFIFEGKGLGFEFMIRDADGNELGSIDGSVFLSMGECTLLDSQGKIRGTIKVKGGLASRYTYTFRDHDEKVIAKMKTKIRLKPSFWVEDPQGTKIYEISGNILGSKYKVKDTKGSTVAQISSPVLKIKDTLEIKNINPLIALLIATTIKMFSEQRADSIHYTDLT